MQAKIISGPAVAIAAVSLIISGTAPAAAKHHHHHHKNKAAKHNCGGKNGCPSNSEEKSLPAPAAPAPAAPAPASPAQPTGGAK